MSQEGRLAGCCNWSSGGGHAQSLLLADGVDEAHLCHVDGSGATRLDNEEESMVPGGVGRSMSCNREGLLDTRLRVASRHRANTAGKSPSANPTQRVRSAQAPRAAALRDDDDEYRHYQEATAQTPHRVS